MIPPEFEPPRTDDHHPGALMLPTQWSALPEPVRGRITAALGGAPAKIESQHWAVRYEITGRIVYDDFVARLTSKSGAALLVKAAGPEHRHARAAYRREAAFHAAPPPGVPVPEPVFAEDISEWTVLGVDTAEPAPKAGPTSDADVRRCLDAWAVASEALNRIPVSQLEHEPIRRDTERFDVFRGIASGGRTWLHDAMPRRLKGRAEDLAAIESGIDGLFDTDAATHGDLGRLRVHLEDDRARISGWGQLQHCPPWTDTVRVLANMGIAGNRTDRAESLFWDHPTSEGVTGAQLDAFLAATAGVMLEIAHAHAFDRIVGGHSQGLLNHTAGWLADRRGWS
ncbi:hypothetical protein [Glycomyces sp. NRRL B-16210]|uniref:hypothetical protein n=1 Tax=Glycomyces sp. NRRL B-16210 TaxID=1463821 RepID=UPI0004BF1BE5|nr:hypothetical protein [Glycomyces sp. NRRL B-16210]